MKKSRTAGMAKRVERLPSKHKALNSNTTTPKNTTKTNKKNGCDDIEENECLYTVWGI
jgi:hypothetical protein